MQRWFTALVFVLSLLLFALWGRQLWQAAQPLAAAGQNQLQPGTDWLLWEERPEGIFLVGLMPPLAYNPYNAAEELEPGVRLVSVDYQKVYSLESLRARLRRSPPGTVHAYVVEQTTETGQRVSNAFFHVIGYQPLFVPGSSNTLWQTVFVSYASLGLMAVLLLVLLIPFLRSNFSANRSIFFFLLTMLVVAGLQLVRYGILLVDTAYELGPLARQTGFIWLALLMASLVLGLLQFGHKGRFTRFNLGLLATAGSGLLVLAGLSLLPNPPRVLLPFSAFERSAYLFGALGWLMFHGRAWRWQSRRRQLLGGGLLLLPVLIIWLCFFAETRAGYIWVHQLLPLSLLVMLVVAADALLRFGKVNLVLSRALAVGLVLVTVVVIYLLVRQIFGQLSPNNPLRSLFEFILTVGLTSIGWLFYTRNRDYFTRFISLPEQRRAAKLGQFVANIPRYTHSSELLADVERELTEYFGLQFCHIRLLTYQDQPAPESPAPLPPRHVEALQQALQTPGTYWTANREVSERQLPEELRNALLENHIYAVFPLHSSNKLSGLVLLGRPRKRYFNLSDIELLLRVVQQTQLTLEILRLLEQEKELVQKTMEANLTALRSQINPHFLFNTLNTISALIHDAPDEAEEAVEKLALIFRYTLKTSSDDFASIGSEISLIRNYLAIEKLRFGDRLKTDISIDEAVEEEKLPSLVLQTIVENCIKHGIAKIIGPGVVRISAGKTPEGDTRIEIYDNGPGIDLSRIRASTGLSNVLTRMERIYDRSDLISFENTGDGTRVTLHLPAHLTS